MSKPVVIGLYSPRPQSGKSTFADHLVEKHGFVRVKFAGPLKKMARCLLQAAGISTSDIESMIEGDLKEQIIPGFEFTPRQLMIKIGDDMRALQGDLWVRITTTWVNHWTSQGRSVVIDDVRYRNEAEAVRTALGGSLVRVYRLLGAGPQTVSEGLLEDLLFDHYAFNNGTIEDLHDQADLMVTRLAA